jgi:hypothetical protein
MRLLLAVVFAIALVGATAPETRFSVTLSLDDTAHAGGRLLLFAEAATAENATSDAVDVRGPGDRVAVAACDIPDFGPDRRVTIDTQESGRNNRISWKTGGLGPQSELRIRPDANGRPPPAEPPSLATRRPSSTFLVKGRQD